MHTLEPNRIRAKKLLFLIEALQEIYSLGNPKKIKKKYTGKTGILLKLKRHKTPNFAQLLCKFPSAIMVIIMKLSFPIFSVIKRCSIICANFNISPLEIINCFHNTELFERKKNQQQKIFQRKQKFMNYEHGNPLPSERNGFCGT